MPLARNLHKLHATHATHATNTPHMLPHDTGTGGRYYGIGGQKNLLLRQIFLPPYGVKPTAYVQTGYAATGWGVQDVCRGCVRYFEHILHS